jgi:hypothetical protein
MTAFLPRQTKEGAQMYYQVIEQCTQALRCIETFLDKAESYAAKKKFDVKLLLTSSLAPDMKNLTYQVQSACDYVKGGAAWLSGQTPPKHPDTEKTVDEIRARIRKTVEFAESVPESQFARASEQKVKLSWKPGKAMDGEDYLLQMIVPNVYFHVAMTYAILRNNGVDVGKMDFLGQLNFEEI